MSLSLAREIAYDAFVEVMEKKRKPEDALEELFVLNKSLSRLDRNFIKEIVYGSLRWYSKMLWILQKTATRNLNDTTPQIRTALVLGTYQIFYMDRVPDRAAVNESAEYVRKKGQAHAVSFVNGILRQIARRAEYFAKPDKTTHSADYLALQFAHPKWIVDRWLQHFKFDRLEVMLSSNNQVPPISVRVNTRKVASTDVHNLQSQLLREERTHSEKRPLRICLQLRESPNLEPGSLFSQGYYTIQDEAAQLIGYLVDPKEGQTVVDACCGPGGKLSHIYELGDEKITLIGVEAKGSQFQKAQETMARLGHSKVEWAEQDFLEWQPKKKVDKILLDAPCSGLGVLRRHPEGKWQKDVTIIGRMAILQKQMIEHALKQIKAGGELVFSVCSFEPEETIAHVQWLMKEYKDRVELVSPVSRLPDYYKRYVTKDNVLLIYSGNQDATDGFGAFIIKVNKEV